MFVGLEKIEGFKRRFRDILRVIRVDPDADVQPPVKLEEGQSKLSETQSNILHFDGTTQEIGSNCLSMYTATSIGGETSIGSSSGRGFWSTRSGFGVDGFWQMICDFLLSDPTELESHIPSLRVTDVD